MSYSPWRILPLAICCALSLAPVVVAQDKPLPVAVLDLDRVFNSYKKHSERLQPLREAAKELDEAVQTRQVEMEGVANQLRKSMPGSPEQQRLIQQAQKLQADLQAFVNAGRQKIQKQEVSILVTTHKDVDEQLKKFCKARGLKLVLRQSPVPDESQPLAEIAKNLGRDVLFQDGLDITDDVIKMLNEAKPDGA